MAFTEVWKKRKLCDDFVMIVFVAESNFNFKNHSNLEREIMKKWYIIYSFLIALTFSSFESFAQCTDAGICQLGGHFMEGESGKKFNISTLFKYGYSGKEDDVQYYSFLVDGYYNLFEKSSIQLLIPYNIQSGPLGDVSGIGDLIVSWNQGIFANENSSFNASLGIKLATGDDIKDSLPQVYQSGLGTNDILLGINYVYNDFVVGAGYQISGGRNNDTYQLEKGDDLLLRASYQFLFDKVSIMPQLLYIQPMSESSILDSTSTEETYVDVEDSNQPQLNLLVAMEYKLNDNLALIGDFAIPFIKRKTNVDGLKRAITASLGMMFSFN